MAKITNKDVFKGVLLGESRGEYFVEGYEWIQEHYELEPVNPSETEKILGYTKKVFAGIFDKRKVNKINLFWKSKRNKEEYIGYAPYTLFEAHKPTAKKDVMVIIIEIYDDKINLIDPVTGEIRQSIKTIYDN